MLDKVLIDEAKDQIRRREYGVEHIEDKALIQIAAVFDGSPDVRKITDYEQLS